MGFYNRAMPGVSSVSADLPAAGPSGAAPTPALAIAAEVATGASMAADPGRLARRIADEIQAAGGWLPFDRFMALALYTPGLGYYARAGRSDGPFGRDPRTGSDFVTAPHLSPLFALALARQVAEAFEATGSRVLTEFGAGTGLLARQLVEALAALGSPLERLDIVDLSGTLRARQAASLHGAGVPVRWLEAWPDMLEGVVIGNEVLDAMPVRLLVRDGGLWRERGVGLRGGGAGASAPAFAWVDRDTDAVPPVDQPVDGAWVDGTVVELPEQASAFVRSLGQRLRRGVALLIDYGFPEREFYLAQRGRGTLMCHRAHRAHDDPLVDVGEQDITAHVDFTAVALAAESVGLDVLGYTSQAHFLLNCGLAADLQQAGVRERTDGLRLVHEHEMGELFKVLALGRGAYPSAPPLGFVRGDRTHRL
jgi:SAM-dependent MidA family methyltransferase